MMKAISIFKNGRLWKPVSMARLGLIIIGFACLGSSAWAQSGSFTDAVSRTVSVFNDLQPPDEITDAISRTVSVFNNLQPPDAITDAVSRAVSVFNNLQPPDAITDAISRAVSVNNNVVDGTIELRDLANPPGPAGQIVTIRVYDTGTTVLRQTAVVTLDAQGRYQFMPSVSGDLDFVARGDTWLSRRVGPFTLNGSGGTVNFTGSNALINGDTNGDNVIDDFDLTYIILDFGSKPSQFKTDVTHDGIVDDFDLTVVIVNFGSQGDN